MKAFTLARLLYRRMAHNDDEASLYLINKLSKALIPGYRVSFPQLGWWKNRAFNEYLDRFDELEGMNADRRWMVHQLCRLTHHLRGDTAECGVYRGASSYAICRANRGSGKVHHVFDSFEGLSEPGQSDGAYWKAGVLACSLEEVKRNLAAFEAVKFYKGWIPERFPEVATQTFSFVHIDVDLEQPTRDSFAFFYPRTEPGGIVLCDDYGFTSCPGATRSIDEFLNDKPEKMIALSGGGGFVIKGCPVGPAFEDIDSRG